MGQLPGIFRFRVAYGSELRASLPSLEWKSDGSQRVRLSIRRDAEGALTQLF